MAKLELYPEKRRALFDKKSYKPACVLLQAGYGGDSKICQLFDDWETAPTDSMGWITGTWEEWRDFAKEVNAKAATK